MEFGEVRTRNPSDILACSTGDDGDVHAEKLIHQSGSASYSSDSPQPPKKLRLKVKLPMVSSSEQKSVGGDKPRHYCVVCNKEFSSGKAYGGHVRIHSKEHKKGVGIHGAVKKIKKKKPKRKAKDSASAVDGEIKCCLCGKEFQTMHSLFGHMRRHPERSWKGIRPPPGAAPSNSYSEKNKNSSCSSSVVENDQSIDSEEDEDGMISSSSVREEDLVEIQEAAYCLMMLAYAASNLTINKLRLEAQKSSGSGGKAPENNPTASFQGKEVIFPAAKGATLVSPSTLLETKVKIELIANARDDRLQDDCSVTCQRDAAKMLDFDLNEPYVDPDAEGSGFTFNQIPDY